MVIVCLHYKYFVNETNMSMVPITRHNLVSVAVILWYKLSEVYHHKVLSSIGTFSKVLSSSLSTSTFAKAFQMVLLTILQTTVCRQQLTMVHPTPLMVCRRQSLVASFIPSIGIIFLVARHTHTLWWFECLLVSTQYKYKIQKKYQSHNFTHK